MVSGYSTMINQRLKSTRALLEQAAEATLPDWAHLATQAQLLEFAKGAEIFAAGVWHPYIYVVRQGVVKLSYLNEQGQEWIKAFVGAGEIFACPRTLIAQQTTDYFAISLNASQLEQLPYAELQALTERYPVWQKAVRGLLQNHIIKKDQRERELLTMSAEQRYRLFLQQYPDLIGQIQLRDLAQYLGITPEALSRIRKRVQTSSSASQ